MREERRRGKGMKEMKEGENREVVERMDWRGEKGEGNKELKEGEKITG